MGKRSWNISGAAICATLILAAAHPAAAKLGSCTDPVVLGTTISATGAFSANGDRWVKMTEVFAEEINKRGGIKLNGCGGKSVPLKFVIYDDQSTPATAVALYEKLATVDNVDFLVGPDWTPIGYPVSPIPDKHKIPIVMGNVSALEIFHRGFKYIFGAPVPSVHVWSDRYFDLLMKQPNPPKSIFFAIHDNIFTKELAEYAEKKAQQVGMKLVGTEIFPGNTKDFTAIVLRMKAAKPDVIYISSFDGPAMPLIQQMHRLKITAKDVHSIYTTGKMVKMLGKDMEGITGEVQWSPDLHTPYHDLMVNVLKKSDVDVGDYVFTEGRLASYLVMIQAIEKAGVVDREKVRNALVHNTFRSPAGDIKFEKNGYAVMSAFPSQVQHGKIVAVGPENLVRGRLIYPSPGWQ